MAEKHGPPVPSWQTYRHQDVWQKFLMVYVVYGFFLALTVFESIGALQQHNEWLFLVPAGLAVFAAFILTRAMYRQIWLFAHSGTPLSAEKRDSPGRRKLGLVRGRDNGWVWDAVRANRALAPEERPAAQDAARRLLWGRWRKFSNVFWPSVFGVWTLAHPFSPAHRTWVQTVVLVFGLVMAIVAQGGFILQAKLRKWMRANQLVP